MVLFVLQAYAANGPHIAVQCGIDANPAAAPANISVHIDKLAVGPCNERTNFALLRMPSISRHDADALRAIRARLPHPSQKLHFETRQTTARDCDAVDTHTRVQHCLALAQHRHQSDTFMIDELKRYVGFTEEDARDLQAARTRLCDSFDTVVDEFYDAIVANSTARKVFRDEAQIERQKAFLLGWLNSLFRGKYDETYREAHSRIGHTHVRIGLPERYMFAAMAVLRTSLMSAIARQDDWDQDRRRRLTVTLCKLLDIELAIMLDAYFEDRYTEVKQGERQAASQVITAVTRLTASLAHEVRNPLNAAQLQLELLKRDVSQLTDDALTNRLTERARTVRDEIDRLGLLLDDYLHLARPDQQVDSADFDMVRVVDETLGLQTPLAAEIGATLIRIGDGDPVMARGDRRRIKQVLVNLIRNALDAVSSTGGGRVEVTPGLDGGVVRVSVCDNGIGFTDQTMAQAFDPFFTTKEGGTGLGLGIVQRIVMAHGGKMELGHNPTGGACAVFTTPAAGQSEN